MTVTASSEMTRMHELAAKQGRKITELEAENERLREAVRSIAEEEGTLGWIYAARIAKTALEENNDD